MKIIWCVFPLFFAFLALADEAPRPLSGSASIPLILELTASTQSHSMVQVSGPGWTPFIHRSVFAEGFGAPDCLALVAQRSSGAFTYYADQIARQLVVRDGLSGQTAFSLKPEIRQGPLIFPLRTIGAYVTAIWVDTVSGQSFGDLVQQVAPGADVLLIYLPACALIQPS